MVCRSFNLPIARARFCSSDPAMVDLLSLPLMFISLIQQATLDDTLESSLLGILYNLRFWLMLPSRWSNDRSIGCRLPSLPVFFARSLSVLCLHFQYYVSLRCFFVTNDSGPNDSAEYWALASRLWTTDEGIVLVVFNVTT